jgi:putative transposon-encoded protein
MDRNLYKDIYRYLIMRKIEIIQGKITLTDEVENVYEKRVTPFGTSAKVGAPRKYIGKRAYVIILKD